jgi:hypothetical protein
VTVQAPEAGAALATAFGYQVLDDLGDQAVEYILALWALRLEMDEEEWIRLLVGALTSLVLQGERLGRAYAEHDRGIVVDRPVVPVSATGYRPAPADFAQRGDLLGPVRDGGLAEVAEKVEERLDKAVRTLAKEDPRELQSVDADRIERLARDEPIQAAQQGYQDGIREQVATQPDAAEEGTKKRVNGYRRGINPDACELCFWLWKEGYVYHIDQPMHRHTGCRCWPIPTSDRLGRHELSPEDQALLDALYEKYSTPKRNKTRRGKNDVQNN